MDFVNILNLSAEHY